VGQLVLAALITKFNFVVYNFEPIKGYFDLEETFYAHGRGHTKNYVTGYL
jgi:hypothetical protein